MATEIHRVYPKFDERGFVEAVFDSGFSELELKDRIRRIAEKLRLSLPDKYNQAIKVLVMVAPRLRDFENWALTTYVELYGLKYFETSVKALKELTKHGTSEFAIRGFLIQKTDRMMPILHEWASDPSEHVRRLAAEGSRPRGVWVPHIDAFKKDPRPVIGLLERLKADPSLYVRKAVANNLNDISKDHPDLVVATARKWQKNGSEATKWIIKRACRTLIKQGDDRVFELLGFTSKPKIAISSFRASPDRVRIGSELVISMNIGSRARRSQKVAIDYRIHYRKANGKLSPKVFKLAERTLRPSETISLSTKHSFRPMTTRRHYPGQHYIELLVNGVTSGRVEFYLLE